MANDANNNTPQGQDQRKVRRRQRADRREDIRFEPGKEDRRCTKRRKTDLDVWDHHEE